MEATFPYFKIAVAAFCWLFIGFLISFIRMQVWRAHIDKGSGRIKDLTFSKIIVLFLTFPTQMLDCLTSTGFAEYKDFKYIPVIPNNLPFGLSPSGPFGIGEWILAKEGIIRAIKKGRGQYTRYTLLGLPQKEYFDKDRFLIGHFIESVLWGPIHLIAYAAAISATVLYLVWMVIKLFFSLFTSIVFG